MFVCLSRIIFIDGFVCLCIFWVETEDKNQMEVTPCTHESNRKCFCKPGFYCDKSNNYDTYCHKPCVPCKTGTFSSKPSLDPACKPHKE